MGAEPRRAQTSHRPGTGGSPSADVQRAAQDTQEALPQNRVRVDSATQTYERPDSAAMPTAPTQEQLAIYRKRLSNYVNEILPKGGFLQSEKFGSRNAKMKRFAERMFPDTDIKNLSVKQWDHFFSFLDHWTEKGVEKLVAHINQEIGDD